MDRTYLIISKEILTDKRIPATARLLLAQLLDHRNKRTGQCNPGEEKLAEELGVCRRTVIRGLAALKSAGWIEIKRTQRGNRYEFPMCQNVTSQVTDCHSAECQSVTSEPPYPLYEPNKGNLGDRAENRRAPAAPSPPKKYPLNAPGFPPRKNVHQATLEAYYREERRRKELANEA